MVTRKAFGRVVASEVAYHIRALLAFRWDRINPRSRKAIATVVVPASAFVLAVANFVACFPGIADSDTKGLYLQALAGTYSDWHAPVLALLWSHLDARHWGTAPLLGIEIALYWTGFALVADGLRRVGRSRFALIALLSGLSPFFLFYSRLVSKDVFLAASLIFSFGTVFWFSIQRRCL